MRASRSHPSVAARSSSLCVSGKSAMRCAKRAAGGSVDGGKESRWKAHRTEYSHERADDDDDESDDGGFDGNPASS